MSSLTSRTTFRCETCGQRFPEERLYLTHTARAALERGIFDEQRWLRGQRHWVVIALVCSATCAAQAPIRQTTELKAYLAGRLAPAQYTRLYRQRRRAQEVA